jgi:hypothetical protein
VIYNTRFLILLSGPCTVSVECFTGARNMAGRRDVSFVENEPCRKVILPARQHCAINCYVYCAKRHSLLGGGGDRGDKFVENG